MNGNHNARLTPLPAEAVKLCVLLTWFTSTNFIFFSPHYLRCKTGVSEAYAAAIFKANKDQELPLTRYIKALPDMTFFIVSCFEALSA